MDKQSLLPPLESNFNEVHLDLSDDSEEPIMSQGLPSSKALDILEKAIDDGVFEDSDCDNDI